MTHSTGRPARGKAQPSPELISFRQTRPPSDRRFGLVLAAVFAVIALWPLINAAPPRWWALAIAAVLGGLGAVYPGLLATPNRLWMRFGALLGAIVSPIVMGIMFYIVLTPVAWVMRLAGRDALSLKTDAAADSYWVERTGAGSAPHSMRNQF